MSEDTTPKTAIILGGTSGLGLAIAKQLNEYGWITAIIGRTFPETMLGTDRFHFYACDLTDEASVIRTIQQLEQAHARPDAFFWTAAMFAVGKVDSLPIRTAKQIINVNFLNARPLVKSVWSWFQRSGKPFHFGAVSSTSASRVRSDQADYAASKALQSQFVRCLGAENENPRGRVGLYAPGGMKTKLYRTHMVAGYDQHIEPRLVADRILDHLFQENWGPHNVTVELTMPRESFAEPSTASSQRDTRLSCE